MSVRPLNPPAPSSPSYVDELLDKRAQLDELQAEQVQVQQTAVADDVYDRLKKEVVTPLRAHFANLRRRDTVAVLREGVDPALLLQLPATVLRTAAQAAATAPQNSALGRDLLTAELHNLQGQERLASELHTALGALLSKLHVAEKAFHEEVRSAWAGLEGSSHSLPPAAVADFYQLAVDEFAALAPHHIVVEQLLDAPRVSASSEGFFLEFSEAVGRATKMLGRAKQDSERLSAVRSALQFLQKPLKAWP